MDSYSDRVVGFVDILGFADLVRRADSDPGLRIKIIEALGKVQSVDAPGGKFTDLRSQNFSDSLILSAKNTPDGFWHLLLSLDALAWNLLQLGVLVRGGVTLGGMHHDDKFVFGVAVNEAYRLESSIAKVPRIVLGARAIHATNEFVKDGDVWETYKNSRLLRDQDGVWFLNYLAEIAIFNRQASTKNLLEHPLYQIGQSLRQIIQNKIDETLDQPDIYAKVDWLARYWNSEVAALLPNGEEPALGLVKLAGQKPRMSMLPFRAH